MNRILLLIAILLMYADTFAQQKVRMKYEYDVVKDAQSGKTNRALYKVYHYDRSGFLKEVLTYGMAWTRRDTVLIEQADRSVETQILTSLSSNINKIGRIEQFARLNDSMITSTVREIKDDKDTTVTQRTYLKLNPFLYLGSEAPGGAPMHLFDEEFVQRSSANIRETNYNNKGRINDLLFENEISDTLHQPAVMHLLYNKKGGYTGDSLTRNGNLLIKNKYRLGKTGRILAIEKTFLLKGRYTLNTIHYVYSKQGVLLRKYISGKWTQKWASEYKYVYY